MNDNEKRLIEENEELKRNLENYRDIIKAQHRKTHGIVSSVIKELKKEGYKGILFHSDLPEGGDWKWI